MQELGETVFEAARRELEEETAVAARPLHSLPVLDIIRPDEAVEVLAGNVARAADGGWQGEPAGDWGWEVWHKYWVEQRVRFYEAIGLPRTSLEEYWQKAKAATKHTK